VLPLLPSGRYTVDPGKWQYMPEVAESLGRSWEMVPRRRGDRASEPDRARCEKLESIDNGLVQIVGAHDPVVEEAKAA
jgi:hypothetical protein